MYSEKLNKLAKTIGYDSYADYVASEKWMIRKKAYESNHPKKCFVCGLDDRCQLHHTSYEHLGNEPDEELIWLCSNHHEKAHSFVGLLNEAHLLLKNMPEKEIEIVRNWMQTFLPTGILCPCCGCMTKIYKRKLNAGMAVSLIKMNKMKPATDGWLRLGKDYVGKKEYLDLHHGEYAKLPYWGLLERKTSGNNHQPETGKWRVTNLGKSFVLGKSIVPKYIYLKHNELIRVSTEMTNIKEALGNKFNYDELMRG